MDNINLEKKLILGLIPIPMVMNDFISGKTLKNNLNESKKILKSNKILLLTVISFFFLFNFSSIVNAQEIKVNISISINPYEIKDAYVVGDSFFYEINLTNDINETIDDKFVVSVYNPKGELLDIPREYILSLNSTQTHTIIAKGGKKEKNETAALPFDTAGDYRINIHSTKQINFYRWFIVNEQGYSMLKYIRWEQSFNQTFDVMSRGQYNIWKQTEKANDKVIEANDRLLNLTIDIKTLTDDMNKATQGMRVVTNIVLFVAFLTFLATIMQMYYAIIDKEGPSKGKKVVLIFIIGAIFVLLYILFYAGTIF